MNNDTLKAIFTEEILQEMFPPSRSNDFFEALFGDAGEGYVRFAITRSVGRIEEALERMRDVFA